MESTVLVGRTLHDFFHFGFCGVCLNPIRLYCTSNPSPSFFFIEKEQLGTKQMDLVNQLSDRLLFAIPKKGRLYEKCLQFLEGADIKFARNHRLDIALSVNLPVALIFLPAADIPRFVGEGNVDLGITGQDVLAESVAMDAHIKVDELLDLNFGKCKLQVQVPANGEYQTAESLIGKRIVTSFDFMVRDYFRKLESQKRGTEVTNESMTTEIKYVGGSVEAACALGVADGIVDLVGKSITTAIKALTQRC